MDRAKTALVAVCLCGLLLCALGAASAQAKGQTAFGCLEGTGEPEYNAKCEEQQIGGGWITEAITPGISTGIEGDAVGETKMTVALGTKQGEIICENAHITGNVKNITLGETMFAHGTEARVMYETCRFNEVSGGSTTIHTCAIKNKIENENKNTITTNKLTSTTTATEHSYVTEPEVGGAKIAEFELLAEGGNECPVGLNGLKVSVTGKMTFNVPTAKRSHLTAAVTTASKELLVNGAAAEYVATYKSNLMGEPKVVIALETN